GARPRLGLRTVRGRLRRRRSRSRLAVDLLLHVGDVVPGGPARRVDAALRQTSAKLRVAEHAAHTGYDRLAVVRDDERLAVLEEARDPAAVRADHGRSGCGRLGRGDAG